MKPFVTGSHAYGTPTLDSDIDLVCLLSKSDYLKLLGKANKDENPKLAEYEGADIQRCLYFGGLNLIVCKNQTEYNMWKQGTEELKQMAPVDRIDAISHFRRLREQYFE